MHVLSVHPPTIKIIKLLMYTVGFLFLFLFATNIHAATVVVTPSTGSYSVGQIFTATIQTNPQGRSVNAVEARLNFDSTRLAVTSVGKTGSAFTLWTTEPTFSNAAGTIDFGGGSPTPFSNQSTLITVTFRVLAEGAATVRVGSASVLAADGMGTDVYSGPVNASYTMSATATPPPTTPPTPPPSTPDDSDGPITFGDPPRVPEAGSTIFLDSEVWYATKAGVFTWDIPFDVDEIALDIATSSDFVPVTRYDPPIEQISLNGDLLQDGIQYLVLQYRNQVGWGGILYRKIMIDTIPPEPFVINVRAGNNASAFPTLTFEAIDTVSGVESYELIITGNESVMVTPDEARIGYLLKNLEDGTYTVTVIARDKAGNERKSTTAVLITAGWTPPTSIIIASTIWDFFKGKNLAIMLLLLVIVGQVLYFLHLRKQNEIREQKLRRETKEIQDQMEKIFSALRDEIYDQINTINKRDRLSKKEKEAVEGLNQALEVSETLIEKEISDVSKILK